MAVQSFPQSSFFTEHRAPELPSPSAVRALNEASRRVRIGVRFNRPPPLAIPSLKLLVKYGADVNVGEIKTQVAVREKLRGRVPVPEVYGWAEDGGQRFLYMELVEGQNLEKRWGELGERERESLCRELRDMVSTWRSIARDTDDDQYIGSLEKNPLRDILFGGRPPLTGPFSGPDALRQFQKACGIDIAADDIPIVFTHDDLSPPNIMLSLGPNPKVVAILDWAQSGWYPGYWEYCKARSVGSPRKYFSTDLAKEWHEKYLPMIVERVDEETIWHPFWYFVLTKGIY